jgi:hypothetical protein
MILSRYWNFHQSNQTYDLAGAGVNQAAGRQLAIAGIESLMGPRTGLDTVEKRKMFCSCRKSNHDSSVTLPLAVQPVAHRYTDWAIPAPMNSFSLWNDISSCLLGPVLTDAESISGSRSTTSRLGMRLQRGTQVQCLPIITRKGNRTSSSSFPRHGLYWWLLSDEVIKDIRWHDCVSKASCPVLFPEIGYLLFLGIILSLFSLFLLVT